MQSRSPDQGLPPMSSLNMYTINDRRSPPEIADRASNDPFIWTQTNLASPAPRFPLRLRAVQDLFYVVGFGFIWSKPQLSITEGRSASSYLSLATSHRNIHEPAGVCDSLLRPALWRLTFSLAILIKDTATFGCEKSYFLWLNLSSRSVSDILSRKRLT